jgi:hypothetical protein
MDRGNITIAHAHYRQQQQQLTGANTVMKIAASSSCHASTLLTHSSSRGNTNRHSHFETFD